MWMKKCIDFLMEDKNKYDGTLSVFIVCQTQMLDDMDKLMQQYSELKVNPDIHTLMTAGNSKPYTSFYSKPL